MNERSFGANAEDVVVRVEVRLFNSLTRFAGGAVRNPASLPAGSTVGDVMRRYRIPADAVHMVWVNGRDITAGLGDPVNTERALDEGDVIALSGPVPYSWGYGSPVL